MTSTESYTTATSQAWLAAEKSVEAWRNGATTFTEQLDRAALPAIDLTDPVTRYFEHVQRVVDANREMATAWAELVTNLSGSVRQQAEEITSIVKDQAGRMADLTVTQTEMAVQTAKQQTERVAGGRARDLRVDQAGRDRERASGK